jgi:hypothetical protein
LFRLSTAASTPAPTTQPGLWPHSSDRRGCLARLIGLVRNLIGYGRELAAALQARGLTDRPAGAIACFGTRDIALILSRIAVALLRADALEAKLLRAAARPDPKPATPRMSSERSPRAPRLAAEPAEADASDPTHLPTPEQIAAEIRRKRVGAVIADICRDLGIVPNHPLWRDLNLAVILNGGGLMVLFKDVCRRTRATWDELTNPPAAPPAPSLPSLEPACTGPP